MEAEEMKYLTNLEIQNLSFPDSDVEQMLLSMMEKIKLEINTDSCYVNLNGGKRLFDCKVKLKNWEKVEITLYEASTGEVKVLSPETADKLVDICEFEYGEKITFKGFGVSTGQWLEYTFFGGDLSVTYENKN